MQPAGHRFRCPYLWQINSAGGYALQHHAQSAVAASVFNHLAIVGQGAGRHHFHIAAQLGHFADGVAQLVGQALGVSVVSTRSTIWSLAISPLTTSRARCTCGKRLAMAAT